MTKFKNPVKINCNLAGYDANNVYGWQLVECDAGEVTFNKLAEIGAWYHS